MKKTKIFRRSQRTRIINRRVKMLRQFGGEKYVFAWSRGEIGRFSKGKIHCSCWMCRSKSYDVISHTDRRKLVSAQQQLVEA